MIGAAANSYMHVIGSQWQRERNAELERAAVSWGGALRDDPNNGRKGDYWTTVLFTLIKQFPSRSKLLIDMPK